MADRTSVTILGATGSIGTSTLSVIADEGGFDVTAVTAHSDVAGLARIARETGARHAAIGDETRLDDLRQALAGSDVEAMAGVSGLCDAAAIDSDIVMAGIVGIAGLRPTLQALSRGARVGLANKECLVCAGDLFMRAAQAHQAEVLPVDSEHNAISQCLADQRLDDVARITLTASGGPFRDMPARDLARVTPRQAVRHPNWSMGAKISVDSATLMNKGLEIIEAGHLFGVPLERIDAVVHPQSIVHGFVSFRDGSVIAHMAPADMRIPIGHVLGWPERLGTWQAPLDLMALGELSFSPPDLDRFPALGLARAAFASGAGACVVLNAANEVAVAAFLGGRIGFLDVPGLVAEALDWYAARTSTDMADIDAVFDLDAETRAYAADVIARPKVATFAT